MESLNKLDSSMGTTETIHPLGNQTELFHDEKSVYIIYESPFLFSLVKQQKQMILNPFSTLAGLRM